MAVTLAPDGTPISVDPDPSIFVRGGRSPVPPAPDLPDLEGVVPPPSMQRPESAGATEDLRARVAPSVIPNALPMSRFALTKQQTAPTGPGINAAPPPAPGYFASSADPNTGQPTALNPSLTKLGKLLTVLNAAGQGAAVGSTQPTFGTGFEAEQENRNQQVDQFQRQQQGSLALQQSRANLGLVDTPWGTMPRGTYNSLLGKVLPAQIAGEYRENVADTQAGAKRDVANIGALSRQKVADINAAAKRDTAAGVPLTAKDIKDYNLPPQFLGTRAKISDLAAAERAGMFENIPMMTDKGLVVVNRKTGKVRQATGDDEQTYASQALAGYQEVPDPENPGHTKFVQKGQLGAGGYEGTGSAALQVPREAMKRELPKDIGTQKTAFNTAIAHAQLLREAFAAVNNGDTQAWNKIANKAMEEFGWSEQPTARLIAEVYAGEINKVINAGHITQAELEKVGGTLPTDIASPGRMDAALTAYQKLAQSKLNQLNIQEQAAIDKAQAKKTKPGNAPPAAPEKKHPVGLVPF